MTFLIAYLPCMEGELVRVCLLALDSRRVFELLEYMVVSAFMCAAYLAAASIEGML